MNDLISSLGLYMDSEQDKLNRFNRFGSFDVKEFIDTGCKEYIFMIKPHLNIYTNNSGTSLNPELNASLFFAETQKLFPTLLHQLQKNIVSNKSPFINLFTNNLKNTADISSVNSEDIETSANIYGTRLYYKGSSHKSDENFDFTLEFKDDKNLRVYRLLKAWDIYNNLKNTGQVTPPDDGYYIRNKISHDKVGMYKILVASDGITILYYAYYWGVYPKGSPRETFSEFKGGELAYSVQFHADFVDDLDPLILDDFNAVVNEYRNSVKEIPLFDTNNMRINSELPKIPLIAYNKNTKKYQLKWEG